MTTYRQPFIAKLVLILFIVCNLFFVNFGQSHDGDDDPCEYWRQVEVYWAMRVMDAEWELQQLKDSYWDSIFTGMLTLAPFGFVKGGIAGGLNHYLKVKEAEEELERVRQMHQQATDNLNNCIEHHRQQHEDE